MTIEGSGASAVAQYVHTDHLTGSSVVTNASGTPIQLLDYHPFGTIRINNQSSTFNEKRKFAGHEYDDESGLSYMVARYYSAGTGRFLSEDPAFLDLEDSQAFSSSYQRSLEQHLLNPQNLNSYSYGLNNPVTFRDPQGEVVPLIILGVWAGIEFGLSAYDAYSTFQTLQSSDASSLEKAVTFGGFAAGLALPGGGYGTVGKQVVKHGGDVVNSTKKIGSATDRNWKDIKESTISTNQKFFPTQDEVYAETVEKYRKMFERGESVPPIEVLNNNGKLYLLEGHHRYLGSQAAGKDIKYIEMGKGPLVGTTWDQVQIIAKGKAGK